MADSLRSGRTRLAATTTRTTKLVRSVAKTDPKIAATPVGTGGSGPLLPLPPSRPPARGPAVVHPESPDSEPLLRFLGVAAFLTVPVALTLLGADGVTHDAAHFLAGYSPERLAHGAIWTLPLSALLLPNVRMIGPTTVFTIAFLLPYALLRGPVRALVVFFSGHVVATLCVAVVAIGATLPGGPPSRRSTATSTSEPPPALPRWSVAWPVSCSPDPVWPACSPWSWSRDTSLRRCSGALQSSTARCETEQLLALGVGLTIERHWHHPADPVEPAT